MINNINETQFYFFFSDKPNCSQAEQCLHTYIHKNNKVIMLFEGCRTRLKTVDKHSVVVWVRFVFFNVIFFSQLIFSPLPLVPVDGRFAPVLYYKCKPNSPSVLSPIFH